MKSGKLTPELLEKLVLSKIHIDKEDILVGPQIGEDCAVVDFGKDVCILSMDPITGAVKDLGKLAVHISCNDIAAMGVAPLGLLFTLLLPLSITEEEIQYIMDDVLKAADDLDICIIGGHTEVTATVNQPVAITTAIGKAKKAEYTTSKRGRVGEDLVLTKGAGIEGTAILCSDFETELRAKIGQEVIEEGKGFGKLLSVVKEGVIAREMGATALHDVTEGGIMGAVYEVTKASDTGAKIDFSQIPIHSVTQTICDLFQIDPLHLISSGSMLIAIPDGHLLVKRLEENGVEASVIGKLVEKEKGVMLYQDGKVLPIFPKERDELYVAIERGIQK